MLDNLETRRVFLLFALSVKPQREEELFRKINAVMPEVALQSMVFGTLCSMERDGLTESRGNSFENRTYILTLEGQEQAAEIEGKLEELKKHRP